MDYQRQLLAELMNPLIPVAKKDFRDPEFCKHHLAGFCPFEIFMNTKVDVQKCNLVHDDNLQKEYQSLPAAERIYDHRFYDYLGRLLSDVERTIKRGHSRLEQKSDVVFDNLDEIREKICILEETIGPQVERICAFGEAGKVAEAMDAHYFIYKLFNELERTRENDPSQRNYRPDKRMEVCQVCGALLANDSTGGRIEAHMIGKQHTGFIRIRKVLEEHAKKTGRDYSRSAPLSSSSSNPPHLSNPDSHYNNRDRDYRGGGGADRDYRGGGGDRGYRGGGGGRYDDRNGGGYKSGGGGGGYRGGGRGDYGRRR